MASRIMARWCGITLAALSISTVVTVRPASAQEIERLLAGIRLGSRGTTVLAKYGNPNDVVIGDIGIRQAPLSANPPAQGGQEGAPGGAMGGAPSPAGAMSTMGQAPKHSMMGGGALPSFPGAPGGGFGDGESKSFGDPRGSSGGGFGGGASFPGMSGGMSGEGGAGGGGVGAFGQTVSPLANEQEVTWVYNRKVGNNVVSYEFLIGPSGDVSQIRVSGYTGGNSNTKRGIHLGSTYKDVVRIYGYPEEHQQVGNVLIASYKQHAHVSFQFLNQSGQTNVFSPGNKVIAITIATVE